MVKELSTDRKRSLNDGENIKLVTLMLGLRTRVLPKPSAQNDLSPCPHRSPVVCFFGSGRSYNSNTECSRNLVITLGRFYLRTWQLNSQF